MGQMIYLSVKTTDAETPLDFTCNDEFCAIWLDGGLLEIEGQNTNRRSALLRKGQPYRVVPDIKTRIVQFPLRFEAGNGRSQGVAFVENALLRLDQVTFPSGAVAYRHVHPGAGYRVMVEGQLKIISDQEQYPVTLGDVWFEPANSPVRAEASLSDPHSSFVRFMVLPVEYYGKPTIEILDPEDAKRPRLQTTDRIIDEVVQLSPG